MTNITEIERVATRGAVLQSSGIELCRTAADLARIIAPEVSACVWKRRLQIPQGLCELTANSEFETEVEVTGTEAPEELFDAIADPSTRRWLQADVAGLVTRVRGITPAPLVVSIAVVTGDECRKFHVDQNFLRLVCTYVGPGTELAPNHASVRTELGRGEGIEAANRRIVPDPSLVTHVPTGAVLLLKGARFATGLAAVHRSPPIARRQARRLVLKMTAAKSVRA